VEKEEFEAHLQLSATLTWIQARTMLALGASRALNSSKIPSWTEFHQKALEFFKLIAGVCGFSSVISSCKTDPSGFSKDAEGG